MGRDIYADLEKIEARGKRKKKGFFSFIGEKEPGEESPPVHTVSAFSGNPDPPVAPTPEPVRSVAPAPSADPIIPERSSNEEWIPLKGRKLKQAQDQFHDYKKILEKNFKSGHMSKSQCRKKAKAKEIELGLCPPETNK